MDWTPTLNDRDGPHYRRIADALSADIAAGRLRPGQQLPTHRALAKALGLDISTITHAYREAHARGLIDARVGKGTFVVESLSQTRPSDQSWARFDLSMNLPPQPLDADLEGRITRGLAGLIRDSGLAGYLNYREPGGVAEERSAAAQWLRARVPHADASHLLVCPGTQCALSILLSVVTTPGDVVLTEMLTYPGMRAAAEHAGVALVGVPTDRFGIQPDALISAIKRYGPKALYLVPTLHNPTTVTMPIARRKAVVGIARASGLPLIEDDTYGALEPDTVPLARLAPELTYYAASVSKCMAPGLRVSFLVSPDSTANEKLSGALRATVQMSPPLMVALVARWLRDGSADAIISAIRAEACARQKLAGRILEGHAFSARPHGHHIWLPLPERWTPVEFVSHVRRQGLAIVGSDAFVVSGPAPNAVRLALGAARSRNELGSALGLLLTALNAPARASTIV